LGLRFPRKELKEGPKDKCKAESPRHFPRQRYEYEVSKDIIPKAVWSIEVRSRDQCICGGLFHMAAN